MFWTLGGSKYLLKWQKKKKKKKTDPHKESRAKKEEKGKDNENLQDKCKNTKACNRKKKGICKIYYLWVTVITLDICQILQEKPNGKLKMVLFRMRYVTSTRILASKLDALWDMCKRSIESFFLLFFGLLQELGASSQ